MAGIKVVSELMYVNKAFDVVEENNEEINNENRRINQVVEINEVIDNEETKRKHVRENNVGINSIKTENKQVEENHGGKNNAKLKRKYVEENNGQIKNAGTERKTVEENSEENNGNDEKEDTKEDNEYVVTIIKEEKYLNESTGDSILSENPLKTRKKEKERLKNNKVDDSCVEKRKDVGNEDKDNDNACDNDIPDGGWGRIVVLGGFLAQMMVSILASTYGILYSEFLLDLETSAVLSSWIFNMMILISTLIGIFVQALVQQFGIRVTSLFASFLFLIGTSASGFSSTALHLMFFYSFLIGIGMGIQIPLAFTIVPQYFKKRLGLANAFMSIGTPTGNFIGPLIVVFLKDQFGFQGGTLVLGAFIFNICISSVVFHPVEWHKKRPSSLKKTSTETGVKIFLTILKNTVENLKLIKSPVAVIVALNGTVNYMGIRNYLMFLPFLMQDDGFSVNAAANVISVYGIATAVATLVISVISDYSWFNMRYAHMIGSLFTVTTGIAATFAKDLTTKTIIIALFGVSVGSYMSLFNLSIVWFVGRKDLLSVISFHCFTIPFWLVSCGPLLGLIRDITGNYIISLCLVSSTFGFCFILYACMPFAQQYEKRIKSNRNGIYD